MRYLLPLIRLVFFWILFFTIQRIFFTVYHYNQLSGASLKEFAMIFLKGTRLDLSMTGYFMLIPTLLMLVVSLLPVTGKILLKILFYLQLILVFIVSVLTTIDIHIYTEWGTKLNSRAIEFLIMSPGEALASSASSPLFVSFILISGNFLVGYWMLRKLVRLRSTEGSRSFIPLYTLPVQALILIIFLRGGFQLAPINQSAVYFSDKPPLNHAALNTEWNLMHSFIENHFSSGNPYVYMDGHEAEKIMEELYPHQQDSTASILNMSRPNIVLIILESFTSDVVGAFGGDPEVSPFLSRIATEGLRFEHIYASGDRTDKGMIALLSGFPSQAVRSIIQQPDKFEKLPSLPSAFKKADYTTSFVYGGESEFANFKSYLLSAGIEKVIDKNDFSADQMNSKWGAHDGFVFNKQIGLLSTEKQPFFSTLLTLSSHEPFEVPVKSKFTGKSLPELFRKAANYTDLSLEDYFTKAKQLPWYKNTLFIIVADHGHRLPKEYEQAYDYRKFRIPLIFYGEVLKPGYRGKAIVKTGSQTDLATTLLHQLKISGETFPWSADLLNDQQKGFAFYSYDNGFGWITDQQKLSFDNVSKQLTFKQNTLPDQQEKKILKEGQAYMQSVFSAYLAY